MQASLFVKLSEKYGIRNMANLIARGHTNAELYSCDLKGKKLVLKIGNDRKSRREVNDNLYGYRELVKAGAGSVVPRNLEMLSVDGTRVLVMEFLQNNFKREAEKRNPRIYQQLARGAEALAKITLCSKPGIQARAITEIKANLGSSYRKLISAGMLSGSDTKAVEGIDVRNMASDRCCIFMLDFTPDNVFLKGGGITVIDPWKQKTYLGTLIPPLSMFASQLFDVYKLGDKRNGSRYFASAISHIGSQLGLDRRQIERQAYLGQALQYALSSHALIGANPTMARRYSRVSIEMLAEAA